MPHTGKTGRYLAWRPPRPGEERSFEVLVSPRWSIAALSAAGCLLALLLAVPARMRMRAMRVMAWGVMTAGLVALVDSLRGTSFPQLKQIDLPIPGLPPALAGLRIAQLSDQHLGMPFSRGATRRAVRLVQAARPDVIVLTGDFVSYTRHLPLLPAFLRSLSAPHGLFAIVGNHDYTIDPAGLRRRLEDLGATMLVNEHRTVRIGDGVLVIAGVDDMWYGHPDLRAALDGVPAGAPVILLAHAPDFADEAAQWPVAAQLAGHTHAGHIRLPGLGPLVLPRHGVRYDRGLQRVGRMWLYVSQGIGGLPIRIGCRAEATLFVLRAEDGTEPRS